MPKTNHGGPRQKGKSRSLDWIMAHRDHRSAKCLKWPFGRHPAGYGRYNFKGEDFGAHRKMCMVAHGAPPTPDHEAAHTCGKGHLGCVNPSHLRWSLPVENIRDKEKHGTALKGVNGPASKLTSDQVRIAREMPLVKRGDLVRLAKSLDIHHTTLIAIRAGKTYK